MKFSLSSLFKRQADKDARRAAIIGAMNTAIEIFTSHNEKTFEEVMTKGIKPFAEAVGLDRVVFYRRLDIGGAVRLGQIYRWDMSGGGLISLDDGMKALPDIPLFTRWIAIALKGGSIRVRESDMAEDERDFTRMFGIKSDLIIPIFTEGEFWGVVSFQDHTRDRYFDEGCSDLLHSAARLFVNSIVREDMTQNAIRTIEEVKHREEMTRMLNKVAIFFLSQAEDTFEKTMTAGVKVMVDAVDVDRLSIWRNFMADDGLHTSQIYRWDRESGGTTDPTPGLEDVAYVKLAPRWEYLLADEIINGPARLLPEAAMLKSFGVVSALVIPVYFNNAFWGFVLFEDRMNERYFDEDSIEMMRSATLLCVNTVIRAEMERKVAEANERTKLMLDTIPISCQWWDINMNIIDCNKAAVKLFGLGGKQEFFDTFFTLMPDCQPGGRRSDEVAVEAIQKAFKDGRYRFDWVHRLKDGTLMEAEVILERIKYKDEDPILVGYVRDLREQKRLMLEIEQADELNRILVNAAPIGITIFDEDLHFIDINDTILNVYGGAKEQFMNNFTDFSPEFQDDGSKSAEKIIDIMIRTLKGEQMVYEWTHRSISGELIPFEVTTTRVKHYDRHIGVAFQYNLQNIKKMEQEITNVSELNRAMVDAAPIGITVFDEELKFLDCNDAIVSAYGGTKEQYIDNFLNFSPDYQEDGSNSTEKIMEIMERTLKGEQMVYEWTHRSITGELIPFEITTTRVRHNEKYLGIAFQYNLSNIKKMEKEIAEAEEMTRAIIEASPVSYMLFDERFYPMDCNDVLLKTLGCPDKQYFLEHYWDSFVPESQIDGNNSFERASALGEAMALNEQLTLEWQQKSAEGELIPMENTLKRIIYKDREIFVTFKYDLRNIKKMMESIREQGELLKDALSKATAASKAKGEFLSNMSHEMRTPLNAIIGMTAIGRGADNIERKDYALDKIDNASTHLLGVINDILDMSKIEANMLELSPIEFNFEKMLQRVVNVVNFRVEEKRQKFTVHVDKQIPETFIGDDQRLAQIITNLLGNAIKFTPEKGSVGLDARFIEEENGLCTIRIAVSDTGIGISEEQQERVFTSFEQAESSTTRKYGGTGLGLAISKSIVELMGGRIWVESEIGKGSTFIFTARMQGGAERKQGLLAANINWGNVRVMVIDDDPDILDYISEIVQRIGAVCDTALGGKEALKLVEDKGSYHIYFVDWKMPGIDGITLTSMLKAKPPDPGNAVVIMISAAEWNSVETEARKAGVDKFLSKPLFSSTIVDVIGECLGVDQAQAEEGPPDIEGCFAGRHILLVEDVEINREIVLALFEPTLLEIDCAENGVEAVRMFSESVRQDAQKYDLIFMDVQMPEMDGYEATRRIRKIEAELNAMEFAKQVPIIAMTANVFREDIEKCLQAGMDGHVGKPLDFAEVMDKLRPYLR